MLASSVQNVEYCLRYIVDVFLNLLKVFDLWFSEFSNLPSHKKRIEKKGMDATRRRICHNGTSLSEPGDKKTRSKIVPRPISRSLSRNISPNTKTQVLNYFSHNTPSHLFLLSHFLPLESFPGLGRPGTPPLLGLQNGTSEKK